MISTILICFFSTLLMGIYARHPIVVTPLNGTILKLAAGKGKELSLALLLIDAFCILASVLEE